MNTIEIFHDTICPWCRIGIQSLRLAIAETKKPVTFQFRSFFLDPTVDFAGEPFRSGMEAKLGGRENMLAAFENVTKVGASIGLEFNFDKIEKTPNTLMSHQVIRLTPDRLKLDVIEAIDRAYFAEGRDIGDRDVLLDIAESVGVDREFISDFVGTEVRLKEIDQDIQRTFELGVQQAPFFVLNNKYAIRGAQPPAAFVEALRQI